MSSKRPWCPSLIPAFSLVAGLGGASVISHHADTVEAHVAAAKVAAGTEHMALLGLCDAVAKGVRRPFTRLFRRYLGHYVALLG